MNDLISAAYSERLRRVCDHIERHLDEPLSIEALSRMAHSSPFHFHRQFTARAGFRSIAISSGCVCAVRHGGWRLTRRIKLSISRWMPGSRIRVVHTCFQNRVWSKPAPVSAIAGLAGWNQRVPKLALQEQHVMDVKIVEFPPTRVAMLTHLGHRIRSTPARRNLLHGGVKRASRRLPAAKPLVLPARPADDAAGSIPL